MKNLFKPKTFFFDVDGTIIHPLTNTIPASAIAAIKHLQQDGHFVGVATGRSYHSVMSVAELATINWDGYVCSNGQQIRDKDKKILQANTLNPTLVYQIDEIADKLGFNVQYQGETSFLRFPPNMLVYQAHNFFHEPIPTIYKAYQGEAIEMAMIYAPLDYDYQDFIQIDGVAVFKGEATYCDVVSSEANKFNGIKTLLNQLKKPIDYIAFGDSLNDVEMLQQATIAVAMGNANELLKKEADMITRSVDQDGIAYALNHLITFD